MVDVVSSGAEAIQLAEEHAPDLALMDIRIKGDMDGTEVARNLRTRFNIPAIYLTAHADNETLERAKLAQPLGTLPSRSRKQNFTPISKWRCTSTRRI